MNYFLTCNDPELDGWSGIERSVTDHTAEFMSNRIAVSSEQALHHDTNSFGVILP